MHRLKCPIFMDFLDTLTLLGVKLTFTPSKTPL